MKRMRLDSTASERLERSKRRRIYIGIGGVLLIVTIAVLIIVLCSRASSTTDTPDTSTTDTPDLNPSCKLIKEDVHKFDCHPDRPISKKACLDRGCCYVPSTDLRVKDNDLIKSSYLGVPSCFFPQNYTGYNISIEEIKIVGSKINAELKRVTPSGFPKDVEKIVLDVTPIDDNRLRIQIQDANKVRYKPEVPFLHVKVKENRKENYAVDLDSDGLLTVTRIKTNQILFQTELSQLIFSDQFIQLSTLLPSKYIYGLGEQKEGILKSTNWTRYTLFNQGDLPVPHRNLYGSHPFYLVMEPSYDASGVFLLNTNAIDYFLQPTPAVTIRTIGGILDFVVFLGPTPGDVVSQYTSIFGRPNFPPRWSLGFQLCKYGYFSLNKTKEILNRNLDAGIPVDVQWHDIDYMQRYLDFTYDEDAFAGLPEFVNKLHEDGRRYIAMISPGVSNTEPPGTYPPFDEGKQKDLFIKDTEGSYIEGKVWNVNYTVFPDFSNPLTDDYWRDKFEKFHSKLDFDGVWIDMNEPLNFLNGSTKGCPKTDFDNPPYLPGRPYPLNTLTLCMSARHFTTEHYNEHNLEAYREAKATHRAMTAITKKRPFIISRASFAGQGVFSGHWSGDITSDWDDLRYTIPAMLAFSLYGMPMTGSDICGFRLNTTRELCARWQSLGAFYPLSRNHNDYDTTEQDPANMGADVINSTKKALAIRYYLLPYLYTLFYRNHVFGETVARPLFFEFPDDVKTYGIEDEFLWGPALLIMPAMAPNITTINPYIPAGYWYDYHTGEKWVNDKGARKTLKAGLTDINVAIRGGYVLPAQKPGKTVQESLQSPYDLLVALDADGKAEGELYFDDGESIETYDKGVYNLIQMKAEKNVLNTTVLKDRAGEMKLGTIRVFGLSASPENVTINSNPVNATFKNNELQIIGTSYSLLKNLTVKWQ